MPGKEQQEKERIEQLEEQVEREIQLRAIVQDEVDALRQISNLAERDASNSLTSLNELTLVHAKLTAQHSALTDQLADYQVQIQTLERKANEAVRDKDHYLSTFQEFKKELNKKDALEREKKELERVVGEYAKLVRSLERKIDDIKKNYSSYLENGEKADESLNVESPLPPASPTQSVKSIDHQTPSSSQSHLSLPALLRRITSSVPELLPPLTLAAQPPPEPDQILKLEAQVSDLKDQLALLRHRYEEEISAHEATKQSLTSLQNEEKSSIKLISSYMNYAQESQNHLLKTLEKVKERNSKTSSSMVERMAILQKGLLQEQERVETLRKQLSNSMDEQRAIKEASLPHQSRLEPVSLQERVLDILRFTYELDSLPQELKHRIEDLHLFDKKDKCVHPSLDRSDHLSFFQSIDEPLSPVPIPIPTAFPRVEFSPSELGSHASPYMASSEDHTSDVSKASPVPITTSMPFPTSERASLPESPPMRTSEDIAPGEQKASISFPQKVPLAVTHAETKQVKASIPDVREITTVENIPFRQRVTSLIRSTSTSSIRSPSPSIQTLGKYINTIDILRSSLARHLRLHPSASPQALRSTELLSLLGSFSEVLRDLEVEMEVENARLPVLKIEGDEVIRVRAEQGENYEKIKTRFQNVTDDLNILDIEVKRILTGEESDGGLDSLQLKSMSWTRTFNANLLQHAHSSLTPTLARLRKQSSSPSQFGLGINNVPSNAILSYPARIGTPKIRVIKREEVDEDELE